MTNRSIEFLVIALLCLIHYGVHGLPAHRSSKDEGVTLPGGQKVKQCYRIAMQDFSHMFMCVDLAQKPLLLTISSVEKLAETASLNKAPPGKYLLSLPLHHHLPSFLQACRPTESKDRLQTFECVDGQESLHVGIRNHLLNGYKWIEIMVDDGEVETASQREPKNLQAAKQSVASSNEYSDAGRRRPSKDSSPADRSDCTDENDPKCDLEDVRSGDN